MIYTGRLVILKIGHSTMYIIQVHSLTKSRVLTMSALNSDISDCIISSMIVLKVGENIDK